MLTTVFFTSFQANASIKPDTLSTKDVRGLQLQGLSIQYDNGCVRVLNQQKLPAEEEWIEVETPEQMVEIITSLKVRGAPLLGIAATFSSAAS